MTTLMALKKFRGTDHIELIYADGGTSIVSSTAELKISMETSTPGDPQNNGRIERSNGVILAHSRTRLVQAGLPSIFWAFACRFVSFMLNTNISRK